MSDYVMIAAFVVAAVSALLWLALSLMKGASETLVLCYSCRKPTQVVVWWHNQPHCRACHLKAKHQRALADRDVA